MLLTVSLRGGSGSYGRVLYMARSFSRLVRGAAGLRGGDTVSHAKINAQAVKSMANVIVFCTEREAENLAAFMLVLLKAIEAWRVRPHAPQQLCCAGW